MTDFVISDTHFGHGNIIQLAKRPHENAPVMNKALIDNWNSVVTARDTVYHLGDFGWRDEDINVDVLSALRYDRLIFIRGNHDSGITLHHMAMMGAEIREYCEIPYPGVKGRKICMFHYPISDWNGKFHGSIHLHGHTHSDMYGTPEVPGRYNVCVEAIGYRPKRIADVVRDHEDFLQISKETSR